jgi:hypothetical protein
MANLYYVNLHSSTFGGEIRGQLVKGATTTTNTGEVIQGRLLRKHLYFWPFSNLDKVSLKVKFNVNNGKNHGTSWSLKEVLCYTSLSIILGWIGWETSCFVYCLVTLNGSNVVCNLFYLSFKIWINPLFE